MTEGYALYIHGLGSGAKSGTGSAFVRYFPQYEWLFPEVNEDPEESEAIIREYIKVFQPKMMAGTSMGGLYTLFADAPETIKVVVNATVGVEHVLRKLGYGKHKFYCKREDGRSEYELNESIVRKFTAYKASHQFLHGVRNLAVFSKDDELVGQVETRKNAKILEEAGFTIAWSDKFGHRLNENVAKKIPAWLKEL